MIVSTTLSSGHHLRRGQFESSKSNWPWHGTTMDHPIARVEEYLEIVRRAMRGEKLDFNGQYFSRARVQTSVQAREKSYSYLLSCVWSQDDSFGRANVRWCP